MENQAFKRILLIDNFDSFTYNLVEYFRLCGCEVVVYRNTASIAQLESVEFDLLVLSPGPSTPKNAGNMMEIIQYFYMDKPIFGICLGHQALVEFFGGSLKLVPPQHGKADIIICDQKSIYKDLPTNIEVARYHSLAADKMPASLDVSARSQDGTIMSFRHKTLPIEGVQYHPESVLSMRDDVGMKIVQNVVSGSLFKSTTLYSDLMQQLMYADSIDTDVVNSFIHHLKDEKLSEDQKLILLVSLSFTLKKAENLKQFIDILQVQAGFNTNPLISTTGIDVCGTGGSGLARFNTSTMVGILLSYCGIPIIKHGNKAASGRFGSFDLLEELGMNLNAEQTQLETAFFDKKLAMLYARKTHPLMGHLAGARSRVGIPTIFNVLGPLLNPYQPQRQFMGTSFEEYMPLIFETAQLMGKQHFVLVRGDDKLDEISISAATKVMEFKDGKAENYEITAEDFGLMPVPFEQLKCSKHDENISIAKKMMAGNLDTEHYKLVAANAAFIYSKFYNPMPLKNAYLLMVDTLKSGELEKHFEEYCAQLKSDLVTA